MPRRAPYVPSHREAAHEPSLKSRIRACVVFSVVAVVATGIAVFSGILTQDDAVGTAATSLSAERVDVPTEVQARRSSAVVRADLEERGAAVSRSDRRTGDVKDLDLDQESGGQVTRTEDLSTAAPRVIARRLLPQYGFSGSDFGCLNALYMSESGWDPHADNPTSTAYGIPQALTGGTHDNLPADYMTNPASQIKWGLDYIRSSYGTPCSAWSFKRSHGWY